MPRIIGVAMVVAGIGMIVFRRGAAGFINESDDMALQGRGNPLGQSNPMSVLLSGVGLLGFGLWILWNAFK
jgi:hypothetical protein